MHIHQLDGYIEKIYLVEYVDKLLLLDGCCRCDVPVVIDFIEKTLCRLKTDLKLVCITHLHPDHAGGANLLRRLTGCQLACLAKVGQWYGGIAGLTMYGVDNVLALWVAHRQGKGIQNLCYCPFLFADYQLNDGDFLPYFSDWQVLDTHGHTDRDMSLWHIGSKQIYIGDLLIKLRHKYVSPFPIYFIEHYQTSLYKIKALSPKVVMMAHGGKQNIDEATWQTIFQQIPTERRTVWETIKHKLKIKNFLIKKGIVNKKYIN